MEDDVRCKPCHKTCKTCDADHEYACLECAEGRKRNEDLWTCDEWFSKNLIFQKLNIYYI